MLDDFNREIKHKNYLKIKKEKLTLLNNNIDQKLEEIKLRKQNNFNRKARELNQKLKLKDEHIKKTLQLRRLEKEEENKLKEYKIFKRYTGYVKFNFFYNFIFHKLNKFSILL